MFTLYRIFLVMPFSFKREEFDVSKNSGWQPGRAVRMFQYSLISNHFVLRVKTFKFLARKNPACFFVLKLIYKMPSAASVPQEVKSVKPEDNLTLVIGFMEKKIRNLDKRRIKLEHYKTELATGKSLDIDQKNSIEAYDTVVSTVDLCRDVVLQLKDILKDTNCQKKIEAKKRTDQKLQNDQARLRMTLKFQDILEQLNDEKVREDFLAGRLGAVKLDEAKLQQLMDLQTVLSMPPADKRSTNNIVIKEQSNARSENFGYLLDGANQPFQDTTYKNMKALLNSIAASNYPKEPKPIKVSPPPAPPQQLMDQNKQVKNGYNANMMVNPNNMHPQPTIDFNQGDLMTNGYQANHPTMAYNHMMPMEQIMADGPMQVQSSYYNQSHIPPLEIRDLMISSNINFLQESQVSPEPAAVYMDPAVVSFGTIQPESLMQMHEQQQQMVPHPPPIVSPPNVIPVEEQVVYKPEPSPEEPPQPQVEQLVESPQEQPEPVKTSWADESTDRWPNEINGESNVWNGKPESNNWSDEVDERRSYRGKPSNRRSNFNGGGYRGRGGYGGNFTNGNRGNSFGSNGYRGGSGNGYKSSRQNYRGNGTSYTNSRVTESYNTIVRGNESYNTGDRGNDAYNTGVRANESYNNSTRGNDSYNPSSRGNSYNSSSRGNGAYISNSRGSGSSYNNRGNNYRGYRGQYQNQQQ